MHKAETNSFQAALWDIMPSPSEHPHHNHIAIFYPPGVAQSDLPPSLALLQEPGETEPLSPSWPVTPRFCAKGRTTGFTLPLEEGTSVYGAGEVVGALERSGTQTDLWNTDNAGYSKKGGKRLYQSHPWLLALRRDGSAYGILIDTTYRGTLTVERAIDFRTKSPGYRVLIIEQGSPQAVLMALAELTGTMDLPPLWALGYQQCRWSYNPDSRVREIADGLRERQIPCDVIWMDIDYMDGFRVFTFDPVEFPNPRGLNDYLHAQGFKSVWMIDPGVKVDPGYALYDAGNTRDCWVKRRSGRVYQGRVWPGRCVFPDFTRADVSAWWADCYHAYMATGIDGVWNDMNEPAVFGGPDWTMPVSNRHAGGLMLQNGARLPPGDHAQYHNVYGMLMANASREGILNGLPGKRPFLLTRSNYLGGQRLAATWTGDNDSTNDHMVMSIPMTLNLGLSGQPFSGPDIGGFRKNATPELYAQWIALGAFFPFCRSHSSRGTEPHEPWAFGAEVEAVARVALQRRYRLLPYLYTLFREAAMTGVPVMRPLFFADPADPTLRTEDQAFLLGNDLLVIPRWAETPALPQGYSRAISLVGEEDAADPYQCQLRIRDGAIIPLTRVIQSTADYNPDDVSLIISLDATGEATGSLYEDSNDGYEHLHGGYGLTHYRARRVEGQLELTVVGTEGDRPRTNLPAATLIEGG